MNLKIVLISYRDILPNSLKLVLIIAVYFSEMNAYSEFSRYIFMWTFRSQDFQNIYLVPVNIVNMIIPWVDRYS